MGVGEGALRPRAVGFEMNRPWQSQLSLKELFRFSHLLGACPSPSSHSKIKSPTWEALGTWD